jgi:Tol biopolymer transport system component
VSTPRLAPEPRRARRTGRAAGGILWTVLSREERILAELLVSRGRVPREVLERLDEDRARSTGDLSLSDLLVGRGLLERGEAEQLEREAGALDAALGSAQPGGGRLGEFVIAREIGRGGMGIVYEAVQEPLGRRVALKVLSAAAALDVQQIERFAREARAAARLDHPGIVRVITSGEAAGLRYFAMDLVDGAGLDQRIAAGPLPPGEALEIAQQVAAALAAAHAAGLVHRDIKPSNILLDREGRARLADFGLVHDHAAVSITRSASVLGTPAYMSPEQAKGAPAAPEHDVYALGAVLFAMLAGRPPFPGDHPSAVLAQLLTVPAPRLREVAPEVPAALAAVVDRALDRNPGARYGSAAEFAADLERVRQGEAPEAVRRQRERALGRALRRVGAAAAAVALVGAVGFAVRTAWNASSGAGSAHGPTLEHLRRATDLAGAESYPSLSADGKALAFAHGSGAAMDVYLDRLEARSPVNLTAACPQVDSHPAISPDGQLVAYASECGGGGLFVVPAGGGTPRRIAPRGFHPAWSPDGRQLAFSLRPDRGFSLGWLVAGSEIRVLDLATGSERTVAADGGVQPAWSPNGQLIAYRVPRGDAPGLRVVRADGAAAPARIVTGDREARDVHWAADGAGLFFAGRRTGVINLWFVPLDPETGRETGPADIVVTPTDEVLQSPSASRDGRMLAFTSWRIAASIVRLPIDPATFQPTGPPTRLSGSSRVESMPDLSPDGRRVAYVSQDGRFDLWTMSAEGTDQRRLTNDPYEEHDPRWSPDGSRIAFVSNRSGAFEVFVIDAAGGEPRQVTRCAKGRASMPVWSPDGRRIAFLAQDAGLFVVDAGAVEAPGEPLLDAGGRAPNFFPGDWSRDGQRLVGTDGRLVVYSFDDRSLATLDVPATTTTWLPDGRVLAGSASRFRIVDPRDGSVAAELPAGGNTLVAPHVSLAPDRRSLVYSVSDSEADIWVGDLRR